MSKKGIIKTVVRIMKGIDNQIVLRDMLALVRAVERHYRSGKWEV